MPSRSSKEHDFTSIAKRAVELYNVTAILENPEEKGPAYRKSGLKKTLDDLEEERKQYSGRADWDQYIGQRRAPVETLIRNSGFTLSEVMQ